MDEVATRWARSVTLPADTACAHCGCLMLAGSTAIETNKAKATVLLCRLWCESPLPTPSTGA